MHRVKYKLQLLHFQVSNFFSRINLILHVLHHWLQQSLGIKHLILIVHLMVQVLNPYVSESGPILIRKGQSVLQPFELLAH